MSSSSSNTFIDKKTEFGEDDEYEKPQIDEKRARRDLAILKKKFKQEYTDVCQTFLQRRVELIKRIPLFWLKAFKRHPRIAMLMSVRDKHCLRYLSSLEIIENPHDDSEYSMKFSFSPNPYFENSTLTKIFNLGQTRPSSTSTIIKWKEGRGLSKMNDRIFGEAHTSGQRAHECETFFKWFVNNDDPFNDDVAKVIKHDIWMKPFDDSDDDHLYDDTDNDSDECDDTDNDSDHSVEVVGMVKDTN